MSASASDRIPLAQMIRELRQAYGASVPYNQLWRGAVAGDFPAERVRSRLYAKRSDLPAIARALGLVEEGGPPPAPPAPPAPATPA